MPNLMENDPVLIINKKIIITSDYYYKKMIVDLYCIAHNIRLAPKVKDVLIIAMINGVDGNLYKILKKNNIVPSMNVYYSYKSRLRKQGFLFKVKSNKWEVVPLLKNLTDFSQVNIQIQKENVGAQ